VFAAVVTVPVAAAVTGVGLTAAVTAPELPAEAVAVTGTADVTVDATAPTALIAEPDTVPSVFVTDGTPAPPVTTWTAPCSALPAALTVPATADVGVCAA
jgi:hypothetical protein